MFVVVTNDKTGEVIQRFSYGPETGDPVINPGSLVSVTGTRNETDIADRDAFQQFANNPKAAAENGINAVTIDASDRTVLKEGNRVDQILGTPNNPGEIQYAGGVNRLSVRTTANSNSAAYGVAQRAATAENPEAEQARPPGNNVGWGQFPNIRPERR